MRILFLPCHSTLEFDEVSLLTELGHDVFSIGSYINPAAPHDIKRPPIQGRYFEHLVSLTDVYSKDNLHSEMIEWADVIIIMHIPSWIHNNWQKIKHKKVIWRTIGQSIDDLEKDLAKYKSQGLKVVRCSPKERNLKGYIGDDAIIRFYKDKDEFCNWSGEEKQIITIAQGMSSATRRDHLNYDVFEEVTHNLPTKLYGPNNEDSRLNGGMLGYPQMKEVLRRSRVYFYCGSQPASYTLAFVEAMMTGIPIVSIGDEFGNKIYKTKLFEIGDIIVNGENGFISNDRQELRKYVNMLLEDEGLAKRISFEGRKTAIKLFEKEVIKGQWDKFLKEI